MSDWVITSDGHQIVSGSVGKTLRFWELESGRLLRSLKISQGVVTLVVTADGRKVICKAGGSFEIEIPFKLWDLRSGRLLRSMEGYIGSVLAVAVTPDGLQVISGSKDKTVKVWDLGSGSLLHSVKSNPSGVNSLAVTPDGRQVVSASDDKTIRLWNVNEAKSQVLFWNDASINCMALSQSERYVCCGDGAGRVWLFEWMGGEFMGANMLAGRQTPNWDSKT